MNSRITGRNLAGWLLLGVVSAMSACQPASQEKGVDFPIVTNETAIKIGVFARTHIDQASQKYTFAYTVLVSTSWSRQKGIKSNDPFSTLGYPVYQQRMVLDPASGTTIPDEMMNRFLNYMISQKLNEFPTRSAIDGAELADETSRPVYLYVETPRFSKIVLNKDVAAHDLSSPAKQLDGFREILKNWVKLCNMAQMVTSSTAAYDNPLQRPGDPPK